MEEIWNLLLLGDISLLVLKIFEIPSFLWNRFEISNLSVEQNDMSISNPSVVMCDLDLKSLSRKM